jgi:hypothetical protein
VYHGHDQGQKFDKPAHLISNVSWAEERVPRVPPHISPKCCCRFVGETNYYKYNTLLKKRRSFGTPCHWKHPSPLLRSRKGLDCKSELSSGVRIHEMDSIDEAPDCALEESTSSESRLLDMMTLEATAGDISKYSDSIGDDSLIMSDDDETSPKNLKNQRSATTGTGMAFTENDLDSEDNCDTLACPMAMDTPSPSPSKLPVASTSTVPLSSAMVVSPLTNENRGHPSPSTPSNNAAFAGSPTSVMTMSTSVMTSSALGMTTISGITPMARDEGSPSSTHIQTYVEEKHRQHLRRHRLDDDHMNNKPDHHSIDFGVTPEDLLGRLQRQPSASSIGFDMDDPGNEGLMSKRLQEIESKKVVLHQKRVSLEQRLNDYVDSEKRMRVMISSPAGTVASLNSSVASPQSLLRHPTPSPRKFQRQQVEPSYCNGDEMVQDYPWTDPRTDKVVYLFSGPLNKMKQPHGWGTMHFVDGQVYEGQVYVGYRWGMGTVR